MVFGSCGKQRADGFCVAVCVCHKVARHYESRGVGKSPLAAGNAGELNTVAFLSLPGMQGEGPVSCASKAPSNFTACFFSPCPPHLGSPSPASPLCGFLG